MVNRRRAGRAFGATLGAATLGSTLGTAALALLFAAPAHAQGDTTITTSVIQSNWYWENAATAAGSPAPPPTTEPSGVPSGDLAVAFTGGDCNGPRAV